MAGVQCRRLYGECLPGDRASALVTWSLVTDVFRFVGEVGLALARWADPAGMVGWIDPPESEWTYRTDPVVGFVPAGLDCCCWVFDPVDCLAAFATS